MSARSITRHDDVYRKVASSAESFEREVGALGTLQGSGLVPELVCVDADALAFETRACELVEVHVADAVCRLAALHAAGVAHGDPHPAHLLRDHSGNLVWIDLEFATASDLGPPWKFERAVTKDMLDAPRHWLHAELRAQGLLHLTTHSLERWREISRVVVESRCTVAEAVAVADSRVVPGVAQAFSDPDHEHEQDGRRVHRRRLGLETHRMTKYSELTTTPRGRTPNSPTGSGPYSEMKLDYEEWRELAELRVGELEQRSPDDAAKCRGRLQAFQSFRASPDLRAAIDLVSDVVSVAAMLLDDGLPRPARRWL